MLPCPKCGYSNELGRIFCHQCGTKLDLSQIKAPSQGGKSLKKKKKSQTWKVVRTLLELAVIIGVLFAIYLAWQTPTRPTGQASTEDLLGADKKRIKLEKLVAGTKPGKVEVTPGEANAFLSSNLTMGKPPEAWLVFAPQALRLEFMERAVKVRVWGEFRIGKDLKKQVYFSYIVVPSVGDGSFSAQTTGGSVGYLPIHPWLLRASGLVERFLGNVKMAQEQKTFSKLSGITISPERVTLEYQPPATP
jgi:hypothetical protein